MYDKSLAFESSTSAALKICTVQVLNMNIENVDIILSVTYLKYPKQTYSGIGPSAIWAKLREHLF